MKEDERLMLDRIKEELEKGHAPRLGDYLVALVMDSKDAANELIEILLEAEKINS